MVAALFGVEGVKLDCTTLLECDGAMFVVVIVATAIVGRCDAPTGHDTRTSRCEKASDKVCILGTVDCSMTSYSMFAA